MVESKVRVKYEYSKVQGLPDPSVEGGQSRQDLPSLVPRLSWNANLYHTESLVSFLHKHDVIKIGQKQKGNILRIVLLIMLQHSVCMLFDAR